MSEELEQMCKNENIKFVCIDNRYTLFTDSGFPIMNVEKLPRTWYIRPVNLHIYVGDKHMDRDEESYHFVGDVKHVLAKYYYRKLQFKYWSSI